MGLPSAANAQGFFAETFIRPLREAAAKQGAPTAGTDEPAEVVVE